MEVRQAAERGRDRAAQAVRVEFQRLEVRQAAERGRDRATQVVPAEVQPFEVRQAAEPSRDRAAQTVPAEAQPFEVQAAERGRDRAAQVVYREEQPAEVRQGSERGRDRAHQVVCHEVQPLEVRQASEHGRDRAAQAILPEVQPRHPAGGVGRHAVPRVQRRGGLPVRAVRPVRAAGRVVKRLQDRPVRRRARLTLRAAGEGRPARDGHQYGQRAGRGHSDFRRQRRHVGRRKSKAPKVNRR